MQKNHAIPNLIYRISGMLCVGGGYVASDNLIPLASFFIFNYFFSRIYPVYIHQYGLTIISNFASVKLVMQLDKIFLEPEMHSYEKREPIPLQKRLP
jgi:hypothetical protein